jgi:hypothetical protein
LRRRLNGAASRRFLRGAGRSGDAPRRRSGRREVACEDRVAHRQRFACRRGEIDGAHPLAGRTVSPLTRRARRTGEKRFELGQELTEGAATMEEDEEARWLRFHQCLRELLPNALRREGRKLAPVRDRPQERLGFRRNGKAEARGEARDAQHPQRVFDKARSDVAEDPGAQIRLAAVGIDQAPVCRACHRIDGQVAARRSCSRSPRRGMEGEAAMSAASLALGSRERVLLARLGMQEDRKIAANQGGTEGRISSGARPTKSRSATTSPGFTLPRPPERVRAPDRDGRSSRSRCGGEPRAQRPPCARRLAYGLRTAAGAR